ncbi:MAG: NAD(+)/NADH kinase [Clostridia bacterium]|nr:NAD(+)/NADH kinase [Clostridia bacterium]
MKKAIIIPNYLKEESMQFSKTAVDILEKNGYSVSVLLENDEPIEGSDLALVLGGDGTLLRACKKLYKFDIPMLGINFGHLGYLTECNPDTAIDAIEKVVRNEYHLENRLMLEGSVVRNGENVYSFVALNEASFYRSTLLKAFTAELYINGMLTQTVVGDGLIVATPTGSTSYNLSAGGPVLTPNSKNIVLTPISPKYFPRSSIVANGEDEIEIKVVVDSIVKTGNPALQIDGDDAFTLNDGDVVKIKRNEKDAKIIKVTSQSFYQVLRKKLSKATYDNT